MHQSVAAETDTDGSVRFQLAQAYQRLVMREQAQGAVAKCRKLNTRNWRDVKASPFLEFTTPE